MTYLEITIAKTFRVMKSQTYVLHKAFGGDDALFIYYDVRNSGQVSCVHKNVA